jgi:hypothetical protein
VGHFNWTIGVQVHSNTLVYSFAPTHLLKSWLSLQAEILIYLNFEPDSYFFQYDILPVVLWINPLHCHCFKSVTMSHIQVWASNSTGSLESVASLFSFWPYFLLFWVWVCHSQLFPAHLNWILRHILEWKFQVQNSFCQTKQKCVQVVHCCCFLSLVTVAANFWLKRTTKIPINNLSARDDEGC